MTLFYQLWNSAEHTGVYRMESLCIIYRLSSVKAAWREPQLGVSPHLVGSDVGVHRKNKKYTMRMQNVIRTTYILSRTPHVVPVSRIKPVLHSVNWSHMLPKRTILRINENHTPKFAISFTSRAGKKELKWGLDTTFFSRNRFQLCIFCLSHSELLLHEAKIVRIYEETYLLNQVH